MPRSSADGDDPRPSAEYNATGIDEPWLSKPVKRTGRSMRQPQRTLFDEVSTRLPLFDDLPERAVERLAAGGFGRGLLTASLRARLRKAGFAHMGALALASPADLMAVRKIGPVRVEAIRAHLLGELARLVPGARAEHDREATERRRLDRLRAMPGERFGWAGGTCADLALCAELWTVFEIPAADLDRRPGSGLRNGGLDRIADALALALMPEQPRLSSAVAEPDDEAERDCAELLRERDREWDEAAPET